MELGLAFGDSVEKREKILNHIKDVGKSFPETLAQYDIDVIIAPGDSWLSKYSAALGGSYDLHIPEMKRG
jgi:amidase